MKAINQICRILTAVLGLCAVVLFFFPFVSLPINSSPVDVSGAQLAFGITIQDAAGKSYNLANSLYFLFTFILSAFSAVMAVLAVVFKKGHGTRIASFVSALIAGITMLVMVCRKVTAFADIRPVVVDSGAGLSYSPVAYITMAVILASGIIGVLAWFVTDHLEVLASKGQKLSIWKKVCKFVREMVAEIKKIVWPNGKTVLRNSGIVLALCAVLGAFIWLVDFLLGLLVNFITTL